MISQGSIDRDLTKIKRWYELNYPLCVFCGHRVKAGHLAHLIRRSYDRKLQSIKLNTGLAHPACHEIFDDHPEQAVYLPRILEVLYIIYRLDERYFKQIRYNFEELADMLSCFSKIEIQYLEHHGDMLQLNYLHGFPLSENKRV
jgi:hypothetical protein